MKLQVVTKEEKPRLDNNDELICHKCANWPDMAEDHNLDKKDGRMFRDKMFHNILEMKGSYEEDYLSSQDFFRTIEIPEHRKIKLSGERGCVLCNIDLVEPVFHYALIKSLCDNKTAQYYLFSKGVFVKSWYIEEHLKHIKVVENEEIMKVKTPIQIVNTRIADIEYRLRELKDTGDSFSIDKAETSLTKYIAIKATLEADMPKDTNKGTSYSKMFEKIQAKRLQIEESKSNIEESNIEESKDL